MNPARHNQTTLGPLAEAATNVRKPRRPVTDFVFRKVLGMEEDRAVRWMLPFWTFALLIRRRQRMVNFRFLCGTPKRNSAQVKSLEKQHMRYYSRLNYHIMRLSIQNLSDLPSTIQATGEVNVSAALQAGKGLLLTVAHAGTWWHAPLYLAARGHRLRAVVNPGLPPRVGEYLHSISDRFGVPVTYVGQDAYQTARETFNRNEIFVIAIDRSLREDRSAWVTCGPAELPMDPGPAILAMRQRIPVIHADTFHDATGRSCVSYSAPRTFGLGTAMTTTESVLQHWGQLIYEQWQRHPEQWWTLTFSSFRARTALPSAAPTHRS